MISFSLVDWSIRFGECRGWTQFGLLSQNHVSKVIRFGADRGQKHTRYCGISNQSRGLRRKAGFTIGAFTLINRAFDTAFRARTLVRLKGESGRAQIRLNRLRSYIDIGGFLPFGALEFQRSRIF